MVERVTTDAMAVTATQALDGMRRPFVRSFGLSWVGRRLAASAWSAFHSALLHGAGIAVATSYAQSAAEERNARTLLVARWQRSRIAHAVHLAVRNAAVAD